MTSFFASRINFCIYTKSKIQIKPNRFALYHIGEGLNDKIENTNNTWTITGVSVSKTLVESFGKILIFLTQSNQLFKPLENRLRIGWILALHTFFDCSLVGVIIRRLSVGPVAVPPKIVTYHSCKRNHKIHECHFHFSTKSELKFDALLKEKLRFFFYNVNELLFRFGLYRVLIEKNIL